MSQAFALKYDPLIIELGYGYRISLAGADILTNWMMHGWKVLIWLEGGGE